MVLKVAMSQQSPNERQFLAALANEHTLKASQGSDFHAPARWLELGKNLHLPESCQPIWENWSIC